MICPPIGLPTRVATATNENIAPVLTPICLTSEMLATSVGGKATTAPDVKPKRTAKVVMAPVPHPGSHRHQMRSVVQVQTTTKTVKRPTLSARKVGKIRPQMEPAFSIETR